MLDLVLAVDDPQQWHEENLVLNWSHYSFLRQFGPKVITRIQSYSAGVYYNTLVRVDSQVFYQCRMNLSIYMRTATKT